MKRLEKNLIIGTENNYFLDKKLIFENYLSNIARIYLVSLKGPISS